MKRMIVEKLYYIAHKLAKVVFETKLVKSINGEIKYPYQDEAHFQHKEYFYQLAKFNE
jgi:hypothetical protein